MEPKAFTEKGFICLLPFEKSPGYGYDSCHYRIFAHLRELSRNLNILSTETDEGKQKTLTQRSSELLHELLSVEEKGDTTETESSIELNLYALKMKRTVKRQRKDNCFVQIREVLLTCRQFTSILINKTMKYQVAIIGGGPAGYTAAETAGKPD